jgi:cytochrome c oxidase assembly protein subunit 15
MMKTVVRSLLVLTLLLVIFNAYLRMDAGGIGCQDWPSCYGQAATINDKEISPLFSLAGLLGGFLLLGVFSWLEFRREPGSPKYTDTRIKHIRPLVLIALVFLGLQIILGGLTSANFAANSCPSLPACEGVLFPDATIFSAIKLSSTTASLSQASIHIAHRWGAILAALAIGFAAVAAFQGTGETRHVAILTLVVLAMEMILGVTAVIVSIPLTLAVAHTALAAILLITLMKLLALSVVRWIPD